LKVPDQVHGITPPGNSVTATHGMELGSVGLWIFHLFMPTIRIPGETVDGEPMYAIFSSMWASREHHR